VKDYRSRNPDSYCLTWSGHEFLDKVRNDITWHKATGKMAITGGISIDLLKHLLVPDVEVRQKPGKRRLEFDPRHEALRFDAHRTSARRLRRSSIRPRCASPRSSSMPSPTSICGPRLMTVS
jgi:Hypothetical protein (DUF2513)